MKVAKWILRYIKNIWDLILFYPASNSFELVGYADANFAGYKVDKKSISRMEHFLGSSLILLGTKKQNSISLSTVVAEYVASTFCCAQILWTKQQLEDFGVHVHTIPFMCDNMGKNPVQHKIT